MVGIKLHQIGAIDISQIVLKRLRDGNILIPKCLQLLPPAVVLTHKIVRVRARCTPPMLEIKCPRHKDSNHQDENNALLPILQGIP